MAAPLFRAAAFDGATTGNPATVTYPIGTVTNDTVVAVIWAAAQGTVPTGWTLQGDSVNQLAVYGKAYLLTRRVASDTTVTFPADWATGGAGFGVALFTYTQCAVATPSGFAGQHNASSTGQAFPACAGPATSDYTAVRVIQFSNTATITSAGTGWTTRDAGHQEGTFSAKAGCMDKAMVGGGTAASSSSTNSPAAEGGAFVIALAIPPAGYSMVI